jgi:hypothetical protein
MGEEEDEARSMSEDEDDIAMEWMPTACVLLRVLLSGGGEVRWSLECCGWRVSV